MKLLMSKHSFTGGSDSTTLEINKHIYIYIYIYIYVRYVYIYIYIYMNMNIHVGATGRDTRRSRNQQIPDQLVNWWAC